MKIFKNIQKHSCLENFSFIIFKVFLFSSNFPQKQEENPERRESEKIISNIEFFKFELDFKGDGKMIDFEFPNPKNSRDSCS
jgi:hypothetical protein